MVESTLMSVFIAVMFHCVDVALIPFSFHCENPAVQNTGHDFVTVSLTKASRSFK